jgi:nitrite reductase/ring-hydroxylating ferredoxin subunit
MKELKVGPKDDDKVLISRYQGKLHAVGNYCSHFGAPMSTGLMFDDKVLCPWHAAAFSVVTGAVENAPGMDGLPLFDVSEKDAACSVRRMNLQGEEVLERVRTSNKPKAVNP